MALSRIVCATDFSELSIRAAHLGAELAARNNAALTVLYVDPPPEFAGLGPDFASLVKTDLDEFRRSQDRFVEANLRKLASELRSHHDLDIDTELIRSRTAEGIVEFVDNEDVDLLVLGHHGAGAHRLFLGSVAARVSRHVVVPTLVVPDATPPESDLGARILVAVDLVDAHSLAVGRGALELARRNAKLELIHAFYEPVFATLGDTVGVQTDLTKLFTAARRASLEQLESLADRLARDGVEIAYELDDGSPAKAVLSRSEIFEADMIAVGAHGRRGVDRLIGTTAERILRRAEVPVLLVPTGGDD